MDAQLSPQLPSPPETPTPCPCLLGPGWRLSLRWARAHPPTSADRDLYPPTATLTVPSFLGPHLHHRPL